MGVSYGGAGGSSEPLDALADLRWLSDHGALAGVHEIIRERRRQVELGYDAYHDDVHEGSELVYMAQARLHDVTFTRSEGTADAGSDEHDLRQAGALAAAEIDRLQRMLAPPEKVTVVIEHEGPPSLSEPELADMRRRYPAETVELPGNDEGN